MANEKRLIDANLLEMAFGNAVKSCRTDLMRSIYSVALKAVNDCPTVDAVEVVRCKDCKYFLKSEDGVLKYCTVCGRRHPVEYEYFCSYGERREGE